MQIESDFYFFNNILFLVLLIANPSFRLQSRLVSVRVF